MNMQTFNAMRSGAKAMQDARGRLDVDQVDDVMDDIKDEMDIAEQVRADAVGNLEPCDTRLLRSIWVQDNVRFAIDPGARRCGKLARIV